MKDAPVVREDIKWLLTKAVADVHWLQLGQMRLACGIHCVQISHQGSLISGFSGAHMKL